MTNILGYLAAAIGFAFFGDMLGLNVIASAIAGFVFGVIVLRFTPSAKEAEEAESRWRDALANQVAYDEWDAGVRGIRRRWADPRKGDVVEAVRIFASPEGYSGYPTLQEAIDALVQRGEYYIIDSEYSNITDNSKAQVRIDKRTGQKATRYLRWVRRSNKELRLKDYG